MSTIEEKSPSPPSINKCILANDLIVGNRLMFSLIKRGNHCVDTYFTEAKKYFNVRIVEIIKLWHKVKFHVIYTGFFVMSRVIDEISVDTDHMIIYNSDYIVISSAEDVDEYYERIIYQIEQKIYKCITANSEQYELAGVSAEMLVFMTCECE